MKKFYVRMYATDYLTAIIKAETEEEAFEIAHMANIDDFTQETECYNIDELTELSEEEASQYDIAEFKQTKEGYEVKE